MLRIPRALRHPAVALTLLTLTLPTLASCAADQSEALADPAAGSAAGFPVTIDHKYGQTTLTEAPERVVTVGFNEQDFALALGVTPVATRGYMGYDYKTRPWAAEALAGKEIPETGTTEINLEQVASADPDLVLGPYAFLEQQQYDQLASIAPTIGDLVASDGSTSQNWQDELAVVGQALGKADRAKELTDELQGQFTKVASDNPQFKDKKLAVAFRMDDGFTILDQSDIRHRFFTDLGFAAPETTGDISEEKLELLDQDVLVVAGASKEELLTNPLFSNLPVVKEDRTVYFGAFDSDLPAALGFSSPLSLGYALDHAAPRLAAASDGDPATVAG